MRSDYVLFTTQDGQFYVGRRKGTKLSYKHLGHFVGFYPTPRAAWKVVLQRLKHRKEILEDLERHYKTLARKNTVSL